MVNHFNNRKSGPARKQQSAVRTIDALRNLKCIFDPASKRGRRWRFNILCALGIFVALYLYYLKSNAPHSGREPFPDMIQREDLLRRN